jgi:hypothetical protein
VVIVVIILANVLGNGQEADRLPADVAPTSGYGRAALPVVPVEVPPVTPEAEEACPALMESLPTDLIGDPSRRVDSDSPFAYAWGEPEIVLVCGVDRPAGWVAGVSALQINGVQWYVDTTDPEINVWTAVDRPVYVQVTVPSSMDAAPVTALTKAIAEALPYQEPRPGE